MVTGRVRFAEVGAGTKQDQSNPAWSGSLGCCEATDETRLHGLAPMVQIIHSKPDTLKNILTTLEMFSSEQHITS